MNHLKEFQSFNINEGKLRSELLGGKGQKAEYDSLPQSEKDELERLFSEIGKISTEEQERFLRGLGSYTSLIQMKGSMLDVLKFLEVKKIELEISYFDARDAQKLADFCLDVFSPVFSAETQAQNYLDRSPIFSVILKGKVYFMQPFKDYRSENCMEQISNWNLVNNSNSIGPNVIEEFKLGLSEHGLDINSLILVLESMKLSGQKKIDFSLGYKGVYDLLVKKIKEGDFVTGHKLLGLLDQQSKDRFYSEYSEFIDDLSAAKKGSSIIGRYGIY